ncbi:unnamed protein product [Penicillium olsonii]|uniref:Mediator of RNA polymerase II transcription subunit 11 n=1 Tax=Penicillium olsonii TaxID=99116 RepID=A0A9W4HMI3_PENOL|nr:unnamed protein product [Penicillium olsonii]CAG7933861.1 unnamed protein product [Penicillium olsonii]CAG8059749.1 unnamed protein product [Penicillium olsonii]CAG8093586.1 unnamed protein product [Penicillium olsonii]CAG8289065.1 unnamed protein product [Penicillium olsonii]
MDQDASQQEPQCFTSADRIRQLNEVDKDVTRLIHSAGLAIQALTNTKPDPSSPAPDGSLDSHKARFKEATSQYFALLSSIDVRLRRQVYALEEASLLAPETSRAGDTKGTRNDKSAAASNSAYNPLEISRLNNRKDTVGKDKEAELWAAARSFVEQLDKPESSQDKIVNDPDNMQVD